ncbi:MAG: substrate-binding domain-containing protein [Bacteroidota bacterium]|nr:substrate-binding domain-containing protein [Bacteroidota bacterium]
MRTIRNSVVLFLGLIFLIFYSCQNKGTKTSLDTPTTGVIKIGVDETFEPIIDSEITVFESIYKSAGIIPAYKPEVDIFNLLVKDSVRMIIASRQLTQKEKEYFESKTIYPKEVKIAVDGIALITNRSNRDTLITTETIRKILTGEIKKWSDIYPNSKLGAIKVIFDNPNSSTVQHLMRTLCKGQTLSSKNVSALKNNLEVANYVSKSPNAIGVIGVNWISNRKDTTCMGFLDKIRVMAVTKEAKATVANSFQPYQAYLATQQYPLTRDIYIIITDPRVGLTSGFTSFVSSDKGQRIILKSGILPANTPLRVIKVNDNF